MSTDIRPEISEKNQYWIPRERYYELLHFCRQFPDWQKEYGELYGLKGHGAVKRTRAAMSDPTCTVASRRAQLKLYMDLVTISANETDDSLAKFIMLGVTRKYSYEYLNLKLGMPASRDLYFDRYRKFFWILSQKR